MNIYLLNMLMILIYAFFCKNAIKMNEDSVSRYQKYNKTHLGGLFIIFLVLSLELGLKGDFAIDTRNYHYMFNACDDFAFLENIYIAEPLFELLNYIIYNLTGSFLFYLFVIAIITTGSYIMFVYKESNIMWLSLLILLCSGNFYSSLNIMRNVLAAALFTFAIKYIYEENLKNYILIVVLLSLIHTSTIFMLPLYYLPRIQWKRFKTSVVIFIVIILGVFLYFMADKIVDIIGMFIYTSYLDENAYGMSEGVSLLGVFKGLVYSGGVLINKKYFDKNNKKEMMIYNGCFLHFIITICGARIFMIQRLVFYLIPFVMLGYPLILRKIDNLKKRRKILSCIVGILILSGMTAVISNKYYFFWDNQYISW